MMKGFPCRVRGWSALAALWLAAVCLVPWSGWAQAEYRAFWVDAWGAGFRSQAEVDTLLGVPGTTNRGVIRDANCNTLFVQVRRRYDVCYPSAVGEPYMSGLTPANFNALQAMLNAAHDTTGGKKRIDIHCWLVTFATDGGTVYRQHTNAPTGSLTNFDNYWPTRDDAGAETADKAFDPGHPLVLQYIVSTCMDLVNNFDIDGIHYDYIRFTANNQGYNPTSIARYNARYGLAGQPGAADEQFKQWRRDQVSAVVRQLYARIQKAKPWVKQSGSFVTWNPSPTSSTRAGFQATRPYYDVYSDWDSWLQEGIVDMAVPMTYYNWASLPNDYTRWMNFEKDRHGNRHMIIGPGIYMNSLDNAILELQMTRDLSPAGNSADGFCGYSYRSTYTASSNPTVYGTWAGLSPRLVAEVTPAWADIPVMPWKTAPTKGHLMGAVTLAGGAWADHVQVGISGPVNRSMIVDGTGFYAFVDLPPGNYTITATRAGLANAQTNATVAIGAVPGNMYERNLTMDLAGPPGILASPQSQTVYAGGAATFAVSASGPVPLNYQWRYQGADLPGATSSTLMLNPTGTNQAGNYMAVVSNPYGSATSAVATLTVVVPPPAARIIPLWRLAPGERAYLTTGSTERGLAHNPASNRLLLAGRANGSQVNVLNADSGADLHALNLGSGLIAGGTFAINMIGAASDGAVYVCNLTTESVGTNLRIYRWANDSAATVPTLAYSGNPSGYSQRFGDTMDVRGSGTSTQILMASRSGTNVLVFTTANGTTFTPTVVNVAGVPTGAFGLGISFGAGNTFWGKASSQPLRKIGFDLAAGTGQVLQENGAPGVVNSVAPIGVATNLNVCVGISIETPDNLQLYDLKDNGSAILVETNAFATDNPNSNATGAVDFGGDRAFALDSGNGILAVRILPLAVPPQITAQPQSQTVKAWGEASLAVAATGTPLPAYQWRREGTNIAGATTPALALADVQVADAGAYSVVVSNTAGSLASQEAVLTVLAIVPPQITNLVAAPGATRLGGLGDPGQFVIEVSTNLFQWSPAATLPSADGRFLWTDSETNSARFYRARWIPKAGPARASQ